MALTLAESELCWAAFEGDFGPLIATLRKGAASSQVQNVIADILEGKLKPPRHRPARKGTRKRHLEIARKVRELARDRPMKAAKADAEVEFKCKSRIIQKAMQELIEEEEAEAKLNTELEALFREVLSRTLSPEEVEGVIQYRRGLLAVK
jgi:hypothetical protein